jgi:hypothetical protein
MIGKMELELSSKNMTIAYLTQEVTKMMGGGPTANDMLMF